MNIQARLIDLEKRSELIHDSSRQRFYSLLGDDTGLWYGYYDSNGKHIKVYPSKEQLEEHCSQHKGPGPAILILCPIPHPQKVQEVANHLHSLFPGTVAYFT